MDEQNMSLKGQKVDATQKVKQSTVKWEDMFHRLEIYKEKHGDCLVPNRYPEDPQLGSWGTFWMGLMFDVHAAFDRSCCSNFLFSHYRG